MVRRALVAFVVVTSGCDTPHELPAPELLVEDVGIASMAFDRETLYWTASVGGEANSTGRVMRMARGAGAAAEPLAEGQFNPIGLTLGQRGLYWGNYGDFVSCGTVMALGPTGGARPNEHRYCHAWPIAAAAGTLTILGSNDDGGVALADLDEETGVITERVGVAGSVLAVTPTGDSSVVLVSAQGGGYLALLEPRASYLLPYNVWGIRDPRGMVIAGPYIYWVDANYLGLPTQIFRTPLASRGGVPELVAELDETLSAPTYLDDAIWFIGEAGTGRGAPGHLVRLDLATRSADHFAVDYLPQTIASDGDQLIVETQARFEDGQLIEGERIVAQPLR